MNISQQELDLIKQYCGQELSFRLQSTIEKVKNNSIKIANTGMVSSGKSSLYNILTGNTEKELFPTGSARTTTSADSYHHEGVEYIDTPGIDVRTEDDAIAFNTIVQSDIILMVHNIKTGPLIKNEVDWLKRVSDTIPTEEMKKSRLIFICTWKDSREKDEDYPEILAEVRRMVYETIGTEITFFDLSAKKYLDGVNKNKELLCKKSGIIEFQQFLGGFVKQYCEKKKQYANEELQKIISEISTKLNFAKSEKQKEIENKEKAIKLKYDMQRKLWEEAYLNFKEKVTFLENLKKKTF